MQSRKRQNRLAQSGFSFLELMMVLAILGIVAGGVLSHIGQVQQRTQTEESKVDDMQEARDFIDQFFRDINQIGFPNSRMIDTTSPNWVPVLANPLTYDRRLAVGLVKIDNNEIRFEADSNGDGTPESLIYSINGSGVYSGSPCPLCLQRSQVDKVTGAPWDLTVQVPNWGTEVNDVVNNPIFTYFDINGNQINVLPQDISTPAGANIIATVKTIQINLTIRNNAILDPKTKSPIETNIQGIVSLNNCSMAAAGQAMSC